MSPATTCFTTGGISLRSSTFPISFRGMFQVLSDQSGTIFDEVAVFGTECSREMAIDVEFPCHLTMNVHGHHDFRLGFDRAGKIPGIAVYVVYDDGLATRSCRS